MRYKMSFMQEFFFNVVPSKMYIFGNYKLCVCCNYKSRADLITVSEYLNGKVVGKVVRESDSSSYSRVPFQSLQRFFHIGCYQ